MGLHPGYDDDGRMVGLFDRFDQQVQMTLPNAATDCVMGTIRQLLGDCALDPALGRAIFCARSAGKPESSVPLEKLSIRMASDEGVGNSGGICIGGRGLPLPKELVPLALVLTYLSRPLQVTRDMRDNRRDELLVKQDAYLGNFGKPPELPEWVRPIWRRAWPMQMAAECCINWHSLPLASLDD